MPMPQQKPGRSKQDYRTPPEFLAAVKLLLRIDDFVMDLATSPSNAVCDRYYTEADNSLAQSWVTGGWNWLNPPFAKLKPWVAKACEESGKGARIAMLVPAGVGANWWRDYVHLDCRVLFLNGRLTFVGNTAPYPKDLCLLLYDHNYTLAGYNVWDWRRNIVT